ncbi:Protein phosphatase PP2A regulatory subunit B [Lobosporangium transversale]|nr:Protein phosphatase PP2A regulatory subunit B [Lobosporangium transversale]
MPNPVNSGLPGILSSIDILATLPTGLHIDSAIELTKSLSPGSILRTLIVDNYDSYTFNLLQLFDQEHLQQVVVIRNDQFTWPEFKQQILPFFDQIILSPGPGRPERPHDFGICAQILEKSRIPVFGICLGHQGIGWIHGAKITYSPEPVHGQIAHIQHNGAGIFHGIPQDFKVVRYHSLVIQEQDLPDDLIITAWCYSTPLIADDTTIRKDNTFRNNSKDRAISCNTWGEKSIMGVKHRYLPHYGVQFHPESICTQYGQKMMNNFFMLTHEFYREHKRNSIAGCIPDHVRAHSVIATKSPAVIPQPMLTSSSLKDNPPSQYSLFIHMLDPTIFPAPEIVFSSLFLTGPRSKAAAWWLDSARQPHPMSRFSFMGGIETRRCCSQSSNGYLNTPSAAQAVIQYSTLHREICIRHYKRQSNASSIKRVYLNQNRRSAHGAAETFWDWVSQLMAGFSKDDIETILTGPNGEQRDFEEAPFDFFTGMVGYFGYEMKRESLDGYQTPLEQQCQCDGHSGRSECFCTCNCLRQPDASFILATQAVVFDHVDKRVYVLGVVNNQPEKLQKNLEAPIGFLDRQACDTWIKEVTRSITHVATIHTKAGSSATGATFLPSAAKSDKPYRQRRRSSVSLLSPFKVDVSEENYLKAIRDSLDYIHEGESYELCLTTQFRAKIPLHKQYQEDHLVNSDEQQGDPAYDLYKILRKLNPAPFSAFLSLPIAMDEGVALKSQYLNGHSSVPEKNEIVRRLVILSSSPERFLKIGRISDDKLTTQDDKNASCSLRTVEMKPIKGTVAVAKGCFCEENEGCNISQSTDGEHFEDIELSYQGDKTYASHRSTYDRCTEARKRENQRRIDTLSNNVKERAENLMIVDLIRNDLAHVCSSYSVRVPYLMKVESYETVHQLVTTVRGELFDHIDSTQTVRACFPPGSMTGAPKLRSVQLLDSLEHHVKRGVYSGCLGYIGIPARAASSAGANTKSHKKARSSTDFAVVIRTAVLSVEPNVDNDGKMILSGGKFIED